VRLEKPLLHLIPLLFSSSAAATDWTSITIFDPPNTELIIRNIGVALDGEVDPDTEFFVSDGFDEGAAGGGQAALLYKYHANNFSSRFVLVRATEREA